ncbi:MAG: hypothetical protein ACPGVG_14925 [Mycobacterium sp.]
MALTQRYCDPDLATGANDGTSEADAWQSLAAMASNYAAGQLINLKKTASDHDPGSDVTLATSAGATTPIYLRAYETTPGDGGLFQMTGSSRFQITGDAILTEGLLVERTSGVGGAAFSVTGDNCWLYRCEGDGTGMTGNSNGISITDGTATCCRGIVNSSSATSQGISATRTCLESCWGQATNGRSFLFSAAFRQFSVARCIAVGDGTAGSSGYFIDGINSSGSIGFQECLAYNVADGFHFDEMSDINDAAYVTAIRCAVYNVTNGFYNNQSGVTESTVGLINNAIGNAATARYSGFGDLPLPDDITLAADPFVDAANGDFTLNERSVCRSTWPTTGTRCSRSLRRLAAGARRSTNNSGR